MVLTFQNMVTKMSSKRLWKDSASLIILAKNKVSINGCNYKILAFKRSENTSFMSNHTVFPGGACDTFDESSEWIKHFAKLGVPEIKLADLSNVKGNRPPIFTTKSENSIKKEISLRITAIREAFEEIGVLICRKRGNCLNNNKYGSFYQDFDREKWQKLVHNDPTKFLDLCKKLDVVPDLWSLYEWSVWLTPATFKKRYETAFFLVAVNEIPDVIPEKIEVNEFFWKTPEEYLSAFKNSEIWLPPPQLYEFSRLANIKDLEQITDFAMKRSNLGSTLILPVQYRCNNGIVGVFPGDDFYPKEPNECHDAIEEYIKISVDEFRAKAKKVHRAEYTGLSNGKVYLNFDLPYGHLSPVVDETPKQKL